MKKNKKEKEQNKQRFIDFISFLDDSKYKQDNLDFLNSIRILNGMDDSEIVNVVKEYIDNKLGLYNEINKFWDESMEPLIFIKYLSSETNNELLNNVISNVSFNQDQVNNLFSKSIKILERIIESGLSKYDKNYELNSKTMDLYLMWFLHSVNLMSNKSNRNKLFVDLIVTISNLILKDERGGLFKKDMDDYKVFDLIKTYGFYDKENIDLYFSKTKTNMESSYLSNHNLLFNEFSLKILENNDRDFDIYSHAKVINISIDPIRMPNLYTYTRENNPNNENTPVMHLRFQRIKAILSKKRFFNNENNDKLEIFKIFKNIYMICKKNKYDMDLMFDDNLYDFMKSFEFESLGNNIEYQKYLFSILNVSFENINQMNNFQKIIIENLNLLEIINLMDLSNYNAVNLLNKCINRNKVFENNINYYQLDSLKINSGLEKINIQGSRIFNEERLGLVNSAIKTLEMLVEEKTKSLLKQKIHNITIKKKIKI